jgi:hypothetical protein
VRLFDQVLLELGAKVFVDLIEAVAAEERQ